MKILFYTGNNIPSLSDELKGKGKENLKRFAKLE